MSYAKYGATIGEFVRRWREEAHMTQKELGEALGVSYQYISNVENGRYEEPINFCLLLLPAMDKAREKYLVDMIKEMNSKKIERRYAPVKRRRTEARV